jgi:homogentisate 1,2-dioxygenase
MCDVNCPNLAVQVHTIFLLLVSYELFDIELALNPFDSVCWPGTQEPYIQVAD